MGICLYDQVEFPWSTNYFDRKPSEPLGALGWMSVDASIPIEPTLEDICYNIINHGTEAWKRYGQDVMFVTHGTPKALYLKLFDREGKSLMPDDLDVLLRLADAPATEAGQAEAIRHFGESQPMIHMIQSYIKAVRLLCPRSLVIRACRIGNNQKYLTRIARLLNARTISAPLQRDFFGVDSNPKVGAPDGLTYNQLVEKVKKVAQPLGEPPNRVLMTMRPLKDHKFNVTTAAESAQGVVNFLNGSFRFARKVTSWTATEGVVVYGVMKAGKYYVFPGMPGYQDLFVNGANPAFVAHLPQETMPVEMYRAPVKVTRREHRQMRRAAFFQKVRAAF